MSIVESFAPVSVRSFLVPKAGGATPGLCAPLRELYENFNGGYFWGGALLVRPAHRVADAPLGVAAWNDPPLWKGEYDSACNEMTFFAEDAFGVQFGVDKGEVVQFDPETARAVTVAGTLDGWCHELLRDPEYYTGFPVLAAWEQKHHPLPVGYRLVPKTLFMLGGEFHSDNMICKSEVEGMRIRSGYWKATKDLPDGTKIEFKVGD
jgi:hypothetical protein